MSPRDDPWKSDPRSAGRPSAVGCGFLSSLIASQALGTTSEKGCDPCSDRAPGAREFAYSSPSGGGLGRLSGAAATGPPRDDTILEDDRTVHERRKQRVRHESSPER